MSHRVRSGTAVGPAGLRHQRGGGFHFTGGRLLTKSTWAERILVFFLCRGGTNFCSGVLSALKAGSDPDGQLCWAEAKLVPGLRVDPALAEPLRVRSATRTSLSPAFLPPPRSQFRGAEVPRPPPALPSRSPSPPPPHPLPPSSHVGDSRQLHLSAAANARP